MGFDDVVPHPSMNITAKHTKMTITLQHAPPGVGLIFNDTHFGIFALVSVQD